MNYNKIKQAIFLERPNRFIARVMVDGKEDICHVKNTGRCRELLISGAEVYLQESDRQNRKTKYDLIGVRKQGRIINMDSQIPNYVVKEWIENGYFLSNIKMIQAEKKYGNSRFDLYMETEDKKIFMEVKGVTLEENGVARFPDAPTERGVKHIRELIQCQKEGYEAYLCFVIQMKGVKYFEPNDQTHKAFGEILRQAQRNGVKILAYDCMVEKNSIKMNESVEVRL